MNPRHITDRLLGPVPKTSTDADDGLGAANQLEVLRRHPQYHKAFRGAGLSFPAQALRQPDVLAATNKRGHAVDVRSYDELTLALSAGIPATRIVMHDDGITAAPIRVAVNANVGRLVMKGSQQVAVLTSCARRPQQVLLDTRDEHLEDAATAVLASHWLNLIGLHSTLAPAAGMSDYAAVVGGMVTTMARIRREHNLILTRVSLAGGHTLSGGTTDLRALAAVIEDAFDDSCARWRFPRPALILAPW